MRKVSKLFHFHKWQELGHNKSGNNVLKTHPRTSVNRILEQVRIYRRLRIGRDGHLDQSEFYDIL